MAGPHVTKYYVEGYVWTCYEVEVEADSFEEAQKIADDNAPGVLDVRYIRRTDTGEEYYPD